MKVDLKEIMNYMVIYSGKPKMDIARDMGFKSYNSLYSIVKLGNSYLTSFVKLCKATGYDVYVEPRDETKRSFIL